MHETLSTTKTRALGFFHSFSERFFLNSLQKCREFKRNLSLEAKQNKPRVQVKKKVNHSLNLTQE
ncbi:unknown protein [Simkania negevensis Z]|uniref:Uncharacterized protein n=1 Tax=Simkania negevensis (strain ATCC VR-1471 / DSM 27360 / Z) TaxID=331113 RepID=F8L6U0_SIMNZ|nr:unknown protein [Simkania negevensis Z]